jgi:hypothetical protein
MTYDRRKLLGSLIGGDYDSLNGIPDRYAELVARQKLVIEVNEQIKAAKVEPDVAGMSHAEATQVKSDYKAAFKIEVEPLLAELYLVSDGMLAFIRLHFNNSNLEDPALFQMVSDLFDGKLVVDTMDEDALRTVEDAVVAIAVAKRMLSVEKVPWNAVKMKEFAPFANRYKALILG